MVNYFKWVYNFKIEGKSKPRKKPIKYMATYVKTDVTL